MGFNHKSLNNFHIFLALFFIFHTLLVFSQPTNNTITQGQFITDGQTIISSGRVFELGFFSPDNSTSRYCGIWYYRVPVQTIVWVANRENPVSGNFGVFGIGNNGALYVSEGYGNVIWSSLNSSSRLSTTNLTAILLDNGNLILSGGDNVGDENNAFWQSYEHPTDTFLPEMRIPMNVFEGENHSFYSWKSLTDPSTGNFSMGMDPRASPQIVTWNGSQRLWRSGHWNRLIFVGVPRMRSLLYYGFRITTEREGNMYVTFQGLNSSTLMNFRLRWDGVVQQLVWNEGRREWDVALTLPSDECGVYNKCGNYGVCSMRGTSQICSCLDGFVPNSIDQWNRGNWSGGCLIRKPLQCDGNGNNSSDGFLKVKRVKLPDDADSGLGNSRDECEEECLRNCLCNSYAFVTGIGCMTWRGELIDVEKFQEGGESLYIRVARSELGGKSRTQIVTAIIISLVGAIFLGVIMWLLWTFRGKLKALSTSKHERYRSPISEVGRSQELPTSCTDEDGFSTEGKQCPLPLFTFHSVETATEYFAKKNKLGEGGFGPVYKGTLPGGQEIAVKRLSKLSGQGIEQFKNEMILIAKLQHRNMVRLLGYCIEREERLLIYEYMPNKSLDSFLFDPIEKAHLDWRTRFEIIEGIARGLLYLHRDSRLKIIHRDLKAGNILLDEEMNPKISDFGMARIFGGKQNEANTNRVVGTYGYMSPEYAMEGLFSVKSDVYSFGILLLEIVSGQKNNSFRSTECSNLVRYAWSLWKEGKAEELIDPSIRESCNMKEALQCIHVAMLCVQNSALHRPTMASVVLMLESENVSLPHPRQPDLAASFSSADVDLIMQGHDITRSYNDVTVSEVIGSLAQIITPLDSLLYKPYNTENKFGKFNHFNSPNEETVTILIKIKELQKPPQLLSGSQNSSSTSSSSIN